MRFITGILRLIFNGFILYPLKFCITPLVFLCLLGGLFWLGWNHLQSQSFAGSRNVAGMLGDKIFSSFHLPSEDAGDAPSSEEEKTSWFKGFFLWAGFTALLPLATFGLLKRVVRKRSNRANALALLFFGTINFVLGFLFLSVHGKALLSFALLCLVTASALFYNMHILSFAVKLEES